MLPSPIRTVGVLLEALIWRGEAGVSLGWWATPPARHGLMPRPAQPVTDGWSC